MIVDNSGKGLRSLTFLELPLLPFIVMISKNHNEDCKMS